MHKNRLEAFSDGVLAIIITIMVLELKVPHGEGIDALRPLLPVALSYLLSFVYVGIYWNNHHHLFQAARQVSAKVLWANLHLLFWLSLLPFVPGWMGENHFGSVPAALYGGDVGKFVSPSVQARLERKPLAHHLTHLAVHGFLHLTGYDHETGPAEWKARIASIPVVAA